MKKVILFLSVVALVSCGGGSSSDVVVDSVKVDTVVVDTLPVADTAAVVNPEVSGGGGVQDGSEIK